MFMIFHKFATSQSWHLLQIFFVMVACVDIRLFIIRCWQQSVAMLWCWSLRVLLLSNLNDLLTLARTSTSVCNLGISIAVFVGFYLCFVWSSNVFKVLGHKGKTFSRFSAVYRQINKHNTFQLWLHFTDSSHFLTHLQALPLW